MTEKEPSAPPGKEFVFRTTDGRVLGRARTAAALRDLLREIDIACLCNHLKPDRNDFASWVEGVLGDRELACRMRSIPVDRDPNEVKARLLLVFGRSHRTQVTHPTGGHEGPSVRNKGSSKVPPPERSSPKDVKDRERTTAPALAKGKKDVGIKDHPPKDSVKKDLNTTPDTRGTGPGERRKDDISLPLDPFIHADHEALVRAAGLPSLRRGGNSTHAGLDGVRWALSTFLHPANVNQDPEGYAWFVTASRTYLGNGATELPPAARVALRNLIDNYPSSREVLLHGPGFIDAVRALKGLVGCVSGTG